MTRPTTRSQKSRKATPKEKTPTHQNNPPSPYTHPNNPLPHKPFQYLIFPYKPTPSLVPPTTPPPSSPTPSIFPSSRKKEEEKNRTCNTNPPPPTHTTRLTSRDPDLDLQKHPDPTRQHSATSSTARLDSAPTASRDAVLDAWDPGSMGVGSVVILMMAVVVVVAGRLRSSMRMEKERMEGRKTAEMGAVVRILVSLMGTAWWGRMVLVEGHGMRRKGVGKRYRRL